MPQLESFLALMSRANADALLLHAGDQALALSGAEQTPIPGSILTSAQMEEMLSAMIPVDGQRLDGRSSMEHRCVNALPDGSDLSVIAIRTDGDLWLELRRIPPGNPHESAPGIRAAPSVEAEVPFDAWIHRAHELGASAVLVVSGARPMVKLGGTLQPLAASPVEYTPLQRELVGLTEHLARAGAAEQQGTLEWTMPGVGIVGCRMIADRRGPGVLFELRSVTAPASMTAVPSELEDLAADGDGLVVIGGRTPDDRTMTAHAVVDVINHRRAAYIIALEPTATVIHDHRKAIVSQRLVGTESTDAWRNAMDNAIAERPDVLVIGAPVPSAVTRRAIQYASEGALVIMTVAAATTVSALEAILGEPSDNDNIAEGLAAVFGALTVRATLQRRGGGRAHAYELLVGTAAIRGLVASKAFASIALAMERGDEGARSMAVSLADLVATNQVSPQAAFRVAPDPAALAAALRHGDGARRLDGERASTLLDLTEFVDGLAEQGRSARKRG